MELTRSFLGPCKMVLSFHERGVFLGGEGARHWEGLWAGWGEQLAGFTVMYLLLNSMLNACVSSLHRRARCSTHSCPMRMLTVCGIAQQRSLLLWEGFASLVGLVIFQFQDRNALQFHAATRGRPSLEKAKNPLSRGGKPERQEHLIK